MTRAMNDSDRFELPDLLVMLCEAGQASLAGRIARSLFERTWEGTREGAREDARAAHASSSVATGGASNAPTRKDASAPIHDRDDREGRGEDVSVPSDEPKAPRSI